MIVNVECPEELLVSRLMKRGKKNAIILSYKFIIFYLNILI